MSPKKKESLNSDFYYGEKAKFFNFYIERMLENFRSTDNEKIQPAEIAEILNSFHR